MIDISQIEPRKQLSFCEANILIENVNQKTTRVSLIARLDVLSEHTQDKQLQANLASLLSKIKDLTPLEFEKVKADILQGNVLFPPDYVL